MSGKKIIDDLKLGFEDVLIQPKRSDLKSRSEVSLERTFTFKHTDYQWTGVPIVAANMDTVGTFEMAKELYKFKMLTALHKHYTEENWDSFFLSLDEDTRKDICNYIMISAGTSNSDFDKINRILEKHDIKFICIDVANGYSKSFSAFISKVRNKHPKKVIFAGNVVTGDMVYDLIERGADVVKIGIGPGSVCTTRKQTGVGYPQLSAILECSDAAHGEKAHICGDGGCTIPGDVAKAFGANGDFVMLGGMLAGHVECGGSVVEDSEGKKFMEFYGMSSKDAMEKHSGGVAAYRSSEGKHVLIPYRGEVKNTVQDLLGGIRSTCTYVGARSIKHLGLCVTFIKTNKQINEVYGKAK